MAADFSTRLESRTVSFSRVPLVGLSIWKEPQKGGGEFTGKCRGKVSLQAQALNSSTIRQTKLCFCPPRQLLCICSSYGNSQNCNLAIETKPLFKLLTVKPLGTMVSNSIWQCVMNNGLVNIMEILMKVSSGLKCMPK